MDQQTSLDVFPAIVTTPSEQFSRARVEVVDGRARVFTESTGTISLALEAAGVAISRERDPLRYRNVRTNPYVLTLTDGSVWKVKKAGGCGCSSVLRSFRPSSWRD